MVASLVCAAALVHDEGETVGEIVSPDRELTPTGAFDGVPATVAGLAAS